MTSTLALLQITVEHNTVYRGSNLGRGVVLARHAVHFFIWGARGAFGVPVGIETSHLLFYDALNIAP
jgi:hypothetical protein